MTIALNVPKFSSIAWSRTYKGISTRKSFLKSIKVNTFINKDKDGITFPTLMT